MSVVPKSIKEKIFEIDEYVCQYCGRKFEYENLTIDHLIPRVKGGDNSQSNLITSCDECNFLKDSFTLKSFYHICEFRYKETGDQLYLNRIKNISLLLEDQKVEIKKIKIYKCSDRRRWYKNLIGKVFSAKKLYNPDHPQNIIYQINNKRKIPLKDCFEI